MLIGALAIPTRSQILSKAIIKKCDIGSHQAAENCQENLIINLTVEHLPQSGEELVVLTGASQEGQYEDRLDQPVKIAVQRDRSFARYPIQYLSSVHGKPVERCVHTSAFECGRLAKQVGSHLGAFCCRCTLGAITGIFKKRTLRNVTQCRLGQLDAIVSYLHYGENDVYHIHAINEPVIVHAVKVSVQVGDVYVARNVSIGTLRPNIVQGNVTVTYRADFPASIMPPSFGSKYLAVAQWKNQTPQSCILEKEMFGLDGRECNKIGVSGEAFLHQPLRCEAALGSCLHNQIENHEEIATERRKRGLRASFYPSDYGTFLGFARDEPSMEYKLKDQKLVSLITIETHVLSDVLAASDLLRHVEFVSVNVTQSSHFHSNGLIDILVDVHNPADCGGVVYLFCDERSTLLMAPVSIRVIPKETRRLTLHGVARPSSNQTRSDGIECRLVASNVKGEQIAERMIHWMQEDATHIPLHTNGKSFGVLHANKTKHIAQIKSCFDCPKYLPFCFILKACFWRVLAELLAIMLIILFILEQFESVNKYRQL